MQIVIDIDDTLIKKISDMGLYRLSKQNIEAVSRVIMNGTPLPKGHGQLIDADALFKWYTASRTKYPVTKDRSAYNTMLMYEIFDEIEDAKTIIEANTEDEKNEVSD